MAHLNLAFSSRPDPPNVTPSAPQVWPTDRYG